MGTVEDQAISVALIEPCGIGEATELNVSCKFVVCSVLI